MDCAVGQKRSRSEVADCVDGENVPNGKKLCEIPLSVGLLGPVVHDPLQPSVGIEVPCLSSTDELPSKPFAACDTDGTSNKASLEETLRSLEEELGVSNDSADFSGPASNEEELRTAALAGCWGDEIWNGEGFAINGNDESTFTGEVGCSSENNPNFESSCSGNSSVLVDGDSCDTTTNTTSTSKVEHFGQVDIGFLLEASDDELGIPPSPSSERDQASEQDISCGGLDVGSTESLHDAVSWALEGGGDNMGFTDSGIEEWMMGNLDFMMDASAAYSTIAPLVEAGAVL